VLLSVTHGCLELEQPGIYSLEGPNGSGKSILIHLLTGALPSVFEPVELVIFIDGKQVTLRSPADALAAGIVTVYQDDTLISSMTVYDQVLLRHSKTRLKDFGSYLWDLTYHEFFLYFRMFAATVPDSLQAVLDKMEPKPVDWRNKKVIRDQALKFLRSSDVPVAVLDEVPTVLSGGTRAAAKLMAAQLYERTRVLILDEALGGVSANIWPRYVDHIKDWAASNNVAVLVVTHNRQELEHWNPMKRFIIHEAKLRVVTGGVSIPVPVDEPARVTRLEILTLGSDVKKNADVHAELWQSIEPFEELVAIVDEDIKASAPWKEFLRGCPSTPVEVTLSAAERAKGLQCYWDLLEKVEVPSRDKRCQLLVAGGDGAMNWGSLLYSTTGQRYDGPIFIPSTADAMIFALTSPSASVHFPELATAASQGGVTATKVATATAAVRPRAVVLDQRFIQKQGDQDLKDSLVRCLRVGLMMDEILFARTMNQLCSAPLDREEVFKLLVGSGWAVASMRIVEPDWTNWARVLSYGDLHDRALQALPGIPPARGACLVLGMILEGLLCGCAEGIKQDLVKITRAISPDAVAFIGRVNLSDVSAVYSTLAGSSMSGLEVQMYAQFNIRKMRDSLSVRSPLTPIHVHLEEQVNAAVRRRPRSSIEAAYLQLKDLFR
jgi:ABC-type branched-subunit amino acid transport system ATPase component